MFTTQLSTRSTLLLLLVAGASSVYAQDPAAGLMRALGRVIDAAKQKQQPAQQAQPGEPTPAAAPRAQPAMSPGNGPGAEPSPGQATADQGGTSGWGMPTASPTDTGRADSPQPATMAQQRKTPPEDEAREIYENAKAEGLSDEAAWIYRGLTGYVKQLHAAAASGADQLTFKNLRVGAEFPMNINGLGVPSATGRSVASWQDGVAPEGTSRPPLRRGPSESWRCWSTKWGMAIECLLTESPELTTAFGETLKLVQVTLTKPQYDYQPLKYAWQMDMHPRIALVHIVADGKQLAKTANEYASGVFRAAPKVSRSNNENGVTPTRSACVAVNSKRVGELTTDDLALRRACANPTTGLFQAMETPETLYKYENAGAAVDIVERQLIDGSTQTSMTLGSVGWNRLAEKRSERVQAVRTEYAARRAKAGQKDF
jgi:hypothetical protein